MVVKEKKSLVSFLACSACNKIYPVDELQTFADCEECGKSPLLAQYELLDGITKAEIDTTERSMWRYREMLPVFEDENIVSLGEGWTPILKLDRLAKSMGLSFLTMKDESLNPTGSFKARGLSMAVSKAKELGVECCIIPTAGNAGGALSAYCAKAGMKAIVVMPRHTPEAFKKECRYFGADLIEVDGLISDCARKVAEIKATQDCFDISTMKEPYRLEGKKTMGYEIAEQMNWTLPDVILYPTGGGTGLIGMWKAFHEMRELGWIGEKFPRMIAVQSAVCNPIVRTWEGKQTNSSAYKGDATFANGLAVPNPFAEKLILNVLHESSGTAVDVTDDEIKNSMKEIAANEGLLICPEGAALLPALKKLLAEGIIDHSEKILFLNTGSAYKYL
ncbi:MAG: threonine synthase [Cyclobacteriaceae bacterium]|nr:threonine synthase [Cyclobacteriaceae bacterium]